jgi:hypothetical protein
MARLSHGPDRPGSGELMGVLPPGGGLDMKVQRLTCYTVSTLRVMTQGRSRLRSCCKHGSVKGAESNPCPYCDPSAGARTQT